MDRELLLAAFLILVGLCLAGAGTHLYQCLSKQQAMLRYDGKTYISSLGHVAMSFICGPYIMLQLGFQREDRDALSMTSMLVASVVAFGWAFITGLLFMGVYVAFR